MKQETVKVKPWAESQGDFVVINVCDFDQDKHEAFDPEAESKAAEQAKTLVDQNSKPAPKAAVKGSK